MFLLRRIRNSSQWADMLEDPLWETPEDCPPSAIWQLYEARKADGALSVWRVKTEEDRENVAAADSLQKGAEKGELQDIAYLELAEEYLKVGNYELVDKAATTPLPDINMRHVDIQKVSGRRFIEFARLARKHGQLRVVTGKRIAQRIAERLASGDLKPASFKVKSDHVAGLIYAVWKAQVITFQTKN